MNQISASLGGCLNFKVPSEGTTCFNGIALTHMSIAYILTQKYFIKYQVKIKHYPHSQKLNTGNISLKYCIKLRKYGVNFVSL